ncbi:carboxymuconolactone decarboxylase family protein [Acinetobacter baumannii]|uniref:carboxymuconolactone decarboxylase family protein n=1 Tax=Acinetobacter baumannii TaxID=470 RepID=UPI003CFE1D25
MQYLSQQQQALIPIAAFAAAGNIVQLTQALNQGLEHGLSINEIKAVLIQTYAYAGFPRSLNALNTFMQVLEKRKAQGIEDTEGKTSSALPSDYQALKNGAEIQTKLVGKPVNGTLFEFAPEIDEYLKAHLFGDIFSRDVLSWQDREIATISMLATMNGTDSQLQSHVNISLNIGISHQQLQNIQQVLSQSVSDEIGEKLAKILN